MRVNPRAYAALLALFAVVAIHASGQGPGGAFARAPVSETAAESNTSSFPAGHSLAISNVISDPTHAGAA